MSATTTTTPLSQFFSGLLGPEATTVFLVDDNASTPPLQECKSATSSRRTQRKKCKKGCRSCCRRSSYTRWDTTPVTEARNNHEEANKAMNSPQRPQRRGSLQMSLNVVSLPPIAPATPPMDARSERRSRRRRGVTAAHSMTTAENKKMSTSTSSPRKPQRRASLQNALTSRMLLGPAAA